MILCIGTTPAVQRVMVFRKLTLDAVNRAVTTLEGAAGKSVNTAKVLRTLGEHPVAIGFLGGDRGEFLRAQLAARGVETDFVTVAARTRLCTTLLDESTGQVTELVEENPAVSAADYEQLLAIVHRRLAGCRAVVLSGTVAPGGPPDLYRALAEAAHRAGALSVVDAQGDALLAALSARPGVVKPNRAELAATVGRSLHSEAEVVSAMRELCRRGAQRVVVTAGKNPTLAWDGERLWRIASPPVPVRNPIGSGDSFTGGLAWRLARGEDLGEACRWAVAAGAANAQTVMPGECDAAEIHRLASTVPVEAVES